MSQEYSRSKVNNGELQSVQKMLHTWSTQCNVLLVLTLLEQDVKLDSGIFPLKKWTTGNRNTAAPEMPSRARSVLGQGPERNKWSKWGIEMKKREENGRKIGLGGGKRLMQRQYLHHRCIDDTFRGGGGGGGVGFTIGA